MKNKRKYLDYIKESVSYGLKYQSKDGSFYSTKNGPHQDIETPVRSTAHFLYSMCWLYKRGEFDGLEAIDKAISYLKSANARPMKGAFWCRTSQSKDFSNGLIGQAWVIESLLMAHDVLGRDDCLELAIEVFSLHQWCTDANAWFYLNVDGSRGSAVHPTFNQQLWMAAVGLRLDSNSKAKSIKFLQSNLNNIELYNDGVIFHGTPVGKKLGNNSIKSILKKILSYQVNLNQKRIHRIRSVGYHSFCLVALKMIKEYDSELVKSIDKNKYLSLNEAKNNSDYFNDIKNNIFSFPYNPVGFELAYYYDDDDEKTEYIELQLEYINGIGEDLHVTDSKDNKLSIARIYELCRCI